MLPTTANAAGAVDQRPAEARDDVLCFTSDVLTEPLTPGQPYELHLDLSITSNVFLPGHRIRLEVSSSNFPRFDRNSNTGGPIADESATEVTVAVNRVLHGPDYPSRLILPVIRR